ncbi:MAG: adenylate/guanylate cyclase domain-containing protein [Candidatus Cloacimonetes bacterium]|nr:adenylate/guanylate cyclase domain-containing protein [Candidatus Cloacimonadota bacterium]
MRVLFRWARRLHYIAVPLLVFIVAQIVFLAPLWEHIELKAYDNLFTLSGSRPVSDDIIIVEIDQSTYESIEAANYPYPRNYHAHLLHNLFAAGARLVVFDIQFDVERDPRQDAELMRACAQYRDRIVLAGKVEISRTGSHTMMRQVPPMKPLLWSKIPWGIVNIRTDPDGFVRRYTLFQRYKEETFYSIGVKALALLHNPPDDLDAAINHDRRQLTVSDGDSILYRVPKNSFNTTLIRYFGPARTFHRVPYYQVIDDISFDISDFDLDAYEQFILPDSVVDGKIVLIGSTLEEDHDYFSTPFYNELMPGVEIHANFLEMALHDDWLVRFPWLWLLALELVLVVGAYALFTRLRPSYTVIITVVMALLWAGLAWWMFGARSRILPVFEAPLLLVVIYIVTLIAHYMRTFREKKQIRSAFQQYMAPELVNELLKSPEHLQYGGQQKKLTVLFSDIRSFTTYTESHEATETVAQLREYLTAMVDIIIKHRGILDKFVGDEVMALFGAPIPIDNHALAACRTALDMRKRLTEMQQQWRDEGREGFEIGIGLNTAMVTVGNLGSEQIFDYTAIGDGINLGARLEALNKEYETKNKIIISEFTLEHVKDDVEVRYLDEVKVKGKNLAVKIYELIDIKDGA